MKNSITGFRGEEGESDVRRACVKGKALKGILKYQESSVS